MPGSVIAIAVISSPEQMPGSQRAFCSSVQSVRKYGQADVVVERPAQPGRVDPGPLDLLRDDDVVPEVGDAAAAVLLGRRHPEEPLARRPCGTPPGRRCRPAPTPRGAGTSSLPMKPRTESRNSSWSASNSVRSMAATVTRWLRRPAGARLAAWPSTSSPSRGRATWLRPTWRRSPASTTRPGPSGCRGSGRSATAAYVDIGPLHAPPRSG